MAITVVRPFIRRREMSAVLECLVADEVGPGAITKNFAKETASYIRVEKAFVLRELRRSIRFALKACGVEAKTQVLLSALAPEYYVQTILEMNAHPVLCDVHPETASITVGNIEKNINEKVKAVIVPTTLGVIPDLKGICELGIPVIEDISEGIGGECCEKKAGSFGQFAIAGLEREHVITAGGGVLLFAAGRKQYHVLKNICSDFGNDIFLSDVNSALGYEQFRKLEKSFEKRKELYDVFSRALMRGKNRTLALPEDRKHVPFTFPVLIKNSVKDVIKYARKKGVESSLAFSHTALASGEIVDADCPNAADFLLRCIQFPLYPGLSGRNIETMTKVLSTLL